MNVPNTITVGRLILAILFFGTLSAYQAGIGTDWILYLSLALFLVAALTDWVDGYIARRLGMETAFGRVADPLVDKVLILGAEGHTSQQIARMLHVSPKTVDAHRTSLMSKLNLHDRTDVVKYALREQLIDL